MMMWNSTWKSFGKWGRDDNSGTDKDPDTLQLYRENDVERPKRTHTH